MRILAAVSVVFVGALEFGFAADVLPADQQATYETITERLIAPCCWSESVADHRSRAAEEVRSKIAERLREGAGEDEIVEGLVAEYGERILIVPEGGKADLLFWTPLAVLLLATFFAVRRLRRLLRQGRVGAAATSPHVEIDDSDLDW